MNRLSVVENNDLSMWDDKHKLQEIRKLFAPKLTDLEFQFFVGMGKATGLNPLCVKYGVSNTKIMLQPKSLSVVMAIEKLLKPNMIMTFINVMQFTPIINLKLLMGK